MVREELRAEGADGGGYSDFFVREALSAALDDLSEVFTIRDVVTFTTVAGKNTYDLSVEIGTEMFTILRVTYDGYRIRSKQLDEYLDANLPGTGPVKHWFLWGNHLTLIGEVEGDKEVKLWVTRAPAVLDKPTSVPDTPRYADRALVEYAVAMCYLESKDYERSNYHNRLYLNQKDSILRRAVPQGHKDSLPKMSESYAGPFRPTMGFIRTDTKPGG